MREDYDDESDETYYRTKRMIKAGTTRTECTVCERIHHLFIHCELCMCVECLG